MIKNASQSRFFYEEYDFFERLLEPIGMVKQVLIYFKDPEVTRR